MTEEQKKLKKYTVQRMSREFESCSVEAENADEALEIAQEKGVWNWGGVDDVDYDVQEES